MKYQIKLLLVPMLARLLRLFGVSWQTLGEKYGREVMLAQAGDITRDTESNEHAAEILDIVILTMIGGHVYNSALEIVLGLALKARGHRVRVILCDQQLPACEVKKATNREHWDRACKKCWSYGQAIFKRFGFEVIPVSELTANRRPQADASRWHETQEASLLKHFGVGVLDESDAVKKRREDYRQSIETTQLIGEALVEMSPDRVLMSHGIYGTWGPQRELLNDAKVPVVTYGKGKKLQTEKFNWTTSADWWDVSKEWEQVREKPLSAEQLTQIDGYLDSRRDHSGDTLQYNFGEEESKAASFKRLDLDPGKPTFVAYTNVLWDAASAQREIVFSDPITWIIETINWFADHPDRQLVVKIHPAEVVIGTNQPFASIIAERIPQLPDNVRIIEPHEKVNSWSIMQIADLGLVHTSTIGMEMPLEGIPCAVVSRTHFRDRGFTIDVNTPEEYFNLIENWDGQQQDTEERKILAKRYAFLLFERYQLPFRFLHEFSHTDVRAMNFSSISNLIHHPVMRLITKSIESKEEFLMPADPTEIEKFWSPVS